MRTALRLSEKCGVISDDGIEGNGTSGLPPNLCRRGGAGGTSCVGRADARLRSTDNFAAIGVRLPAGQVGNAGARGV
jgi:hypothetical protein